MTEAVVSMLLDRLTPVIEEKVREKVCLLLNANKEAKSMSSKLEKIRQVLNDADGKITDPRIKSWLDKLQEIAYEIDDALDEWEVENIRRKLKESEDALGSSSEDPRKKVSSFLKSLYACFKRTARRRSIALDIKNINERLDNIEQENGREFNFTPNVGEVSTNQDFKRVETTAFVDESEIVGRDYDKNWLMSKLLSSSSNSSSQGKKEIQVISIWGTGGMGKTTLAQLAFKEIKKGNEFEPIWVCVSDPFDGVKVSQTILDQLEAVYPQDSQLHTLLEIIERTISGKKFFLVLDDVWTEDYKIKIWEQLRESLRSGAPGSRILVTTRKESVADIMRSTDKHRVGRLSDADCWSLMSRIAFNERSEPEREILRNPGKAIAKKCNSMPLAAKAMGGLLRKKRSLQEWEDVLKSEMWVKEMEEEVFPVIALSYNELDPAVKRCFSYCAIFPKDSVIEVDELIRFWMAQGLLSLSENMERLGREYFIDLAARSFFQDFVRGYGDNTHCISDCKMHDVVHDFAKLLTKNEYLFVGEGERVVAAPNAKVRHLNLEGYGDRPGATSLLPELRSLLCEIEIPPNLFSHLKRVRLLKLTNCRLHDIPEEIGNLIHIRCLDLSHNENITNLPEAICDLYNLQTLGILACDSLRGLPQGVGKLTNLRHVLNWRTPRNFEYPQGFAKLTNLRTLQEYRCSKLEYLKDMHQLQSIHIWLTDGLDMADAKKAELKNLQELRTLVFHIVERLPVIIDDAQPPPNLEILVLKGAMFPKWITTLTNLREFDFKEDTHYSETRPDDYPSCYKSFPCLGRLPFLEKLSVENMKALEHIGHEFLAVNTINETTTASFISFPNLLSLHIGFCQMWEEWEDISEEEEENSSISILPRLEELTIIRCGKLMALPHRLLRKASSLQHLHVSGHQTLWIRYNRKTGQDWNKFHISEK